MAGVLIRATLEANEGKGEAIHDSREGCSNGGFVLRKKVGIGYMTEVLGIGQVMHVACRAGNDIYK